MTSPDARGDKEQGRTSWGNRHTESCRSNGCPCYKDGQDSLVAALVQRDDDMEAGKPYQDGLAKGFAEAYALFGPELESLRAFKAEHSGRSTSE